MRNPGRNDESVNSNSVTHDAISQDTDDADTMGFSNDKESTISARGISSSEYGGTQTHIPSEFMRG